MANKILHKRSNISGDSPELGSLDSGELAINTGDGYLFFKKSSESGNYLCKFIDLEGQSHLLNASLSGFIPQFGNNSISEVFASILGGFGNIVNGAASSIVNGENNKIESDFSSTVNGINNNMDLGADYSFIAGGQNNRVSHSNVFTLGSNLSSHANDFTYVNNVSATGKIYGDGSGLTGIKNDFLPLSGGTLTGSFKLSGSVNTVFYVEEKVGINTEIPNKELTVIGSISATNVIYTNNDVEITDNTKGIILRSPNDSRWRITILNDGTLSATSL